MSDITYPCGDCGHDAIRHGIPGERCLGSDDCDCRKSQGFVISKSQENTIAQQRQTIDALMAALEQIKNIQSTTNDPIAAANRCMDIATAMLEKVRGEKKQDENKEIS